MAPAKPLDNLEDMATALVLLEDGTEEDWLEVLRYRSAELIRSKFVPIHGRNNVYYLYHSMDGAPVYLCISLEEDPSPETVKKALDLGLLVAC
jgi:hypothetical protein